MKAYITGTSSGIGRALALKLLKEGHIVVGISRNCTISELNYTHISLDLSNLQAVTNFDFEANSKDDIILINNSGIIGPIKPIGHHVEKEIIDVNVINVIAPQILTNKFINKFSLSNQNYQVINISSGAGKNPIDAWSTYCGSKAAIDMFSETVSQELKNRNYTNWNVFSIAPGVVNTNMQSVIRASNPTQFLGHKKFIDLHLNNELSDPNYTANLYYKVILNPKNYKKVVFSVRDLS